MQWISLKLIKNYKTKNSIYKIFKINKFINQKFRKEPQMSKLFFILFCFRSIFLNKYEDFRPILGDKYHKTPLKNNN